MSTQHTPRRPEPSDADMLLQARAARALLIEHHEAEGDNSGAHACIFGTLVEGIQYLIRTHKFLDDVRTSDAARAERAETEAQRLRDELAETKRPLDAEMARLNAAVIAANERADIAMVILAKATGAAP